jgi:hypothetical protein
MKTGLVAACAAALLLLGLLAYWNTQPARSSAPEIRAREDALVLDSRPLDLEAAEETPKSEPAPTPRAEVELPPAPEPGLADDMADQIAFAKMYAGVDASGRSAAREAILKASRPGT